MDLPLLEHESFLWVLGLVVGLPALIIVLGEVSERLRSRGNPLAGWVMQVRHLLLPLLATFLIVWQILGIDRAETGVRLLETLLWGALLLAGMTLISSLTGLGEFSPGTWIARVPGLFFALGRALILFSAVYYVLTIIWGVDISSLITAVGVGSLVVALALQDTLSSVVSGFLLVVDRPFELGDWVQIGDHRGKVIDLNWRAVRLYAADDIVVIPNSSLTGEAIVNFTQQFELTEDYFYIGFSYNDPPHKVHNVLKDVALSISEIESAKVRTRSFDDSSIGYQLVYIYAPFKSFRHRSDLRSEIGTRVYYAAQRHGLTIPYPIAVEYGGKVDDLAPPDRQNVIRERLQALPALSSLTDEEIQHLTDLASYSVYGADEMLAVQGEVGAGLTIIHTGGVLITVTDDNGDTHEMARLIPGEIFGETALLQNELSPVSVVATADTEVVILNHEAIVGLSETHHRFGLAMSSFIEERMQQIATALSVDMHQVQQGAKNGQVKLVR